MTDGGPHFDNKAVHDFCAGWGTDTHIISAYSLWVNGLVEGANKILLHILKQLCSPNLGEDDYNGGLYLARVNPYGFHMESMESLLAEASANLLFHGHHGFHVE